MLHSKNSENQNIREAQYKDIQEINEIEQEVFGGSFYKPTPIQDIFKYIDKAHKTKSNKTFVYEEDNKIAGYIMVIYSQEIEQPYILTFAVRPEHRGKNIGTKLLDFCIAYYKNNTNFKVLTALAKPKAESFYLKRGWRKITHIPRFIYLKF